MTNDLQQREIFHLEFLRAFGRSVPADRYVLKGGTNLRFFFGSIRYSQDMDIDVHDVPVQTLKEKVMDVLESRTLGIVLKPFHIAEIIPPDMGKAKQTKTVQRFKTHLITSSGEDLFTKIEFSRRGLDPLVRRETVMPEITRFYQVAPLIVPHYSLETAVLQKIRALSDRKQIQARDVFDLFVLHNRYHRPGWTESIPEEKVKMANANALSITYRQYVDTVVAYFSEEEQSNWGTESSWDEIRLRVSEFLERFRT